MRLQSVSCLWFTGADYMTGKYEPTVKCEIIMPFLNLCTANDLFVE